MVPGAWHIGLLPAFISACCFISWIQTQAVCPFNEVELLTAFGVNAVWEAKCPTASSGRGNLEVQSRQRPLAVGVCRRAADTSAHLHEGLHGQHMHSVISAPAIGFEISLGLLSTDDQCIRHVDCLS